MPDPVKSKLDEEIIKRDLAFHHLFEEILKHYVSATGDVPTGVHREIAIRHLGGNSSIIVSELRIEFTSKVI